MNTNKRVILILIVVVVFALIKLNAFVLADELESLRGLQGVRVAVEKLSAEIERDGLAQAELKTDMEQKLRLAGLKVLTIEETRELHTEPYLRLAVQVLKSRSGFYVYSIGIELRERVRPLRKPRQSTWATTWDSLVRFGWSPNTSDIRNTAKDVVDEFVNAYLSVNPKQGRGYGQKGMILDGITGRDCGVRR
jgi:hypothetical protein